MTQREIKFRAWLKNVGIMISVYVLDQTGNAGRGTHFEKSKGYSEHGGHFVFNIDEAELMQYTGLKDKNGKEIYEGDIMNDHRGINRIVIYDNEYAAFSVVIELGDNDPNSLFEWTHFEVIGNIYENTELL